MRGVHVVLKSAGASTLKVKKTHLVSQIRGAGRRGAGHFEGGVKGGERTWERP